MANAEQIEVVANRRGVDVATLRGERCMMGVRVGAMEDATYNCSDMEGRNRTEWQTQRSEEKV